MKVTPSDMGVCNTSQVCIPRHPIYGETERFLHVWPKLARIFLLKSYLFTGSLWRCLSWSQANLHFGHQQFSLITDMILPNLTLSLFPLFLNYQILYFPLLQFLTCLGICWYCKIPMDARYCVATVRGIILSRLLVEEGHQLTPQPKLSPVVE